MKPVLYNTLKSLSLYCVCSSLHCSAFLLSFIFLSCLEGRKLLCCSKSFCFPPPQHQRWLEGEAHFPVSRVSQLTKNLGFPVRIRSRLTELRNFPNSQPVDGQAGRRTGGRRRGRDPSKGAAELTRPGNLQSSFLCRRQKESRLRSMILDTTALRYSLNRAMLKPHELHIVPLFMSSGSAEGEISQWEGLH